MKIPVLLLAGASFLLLSASASRAEIKVTAEHNSNEDASSAFKFKTIPPPSKSDEASAAHFSVIDGEQDDNGGGTEKLHDGKAPTEADQPAENFFFNAGTDGGRLLVDLKSVTEVSRIYTYSWHPGDRGPQVYKLYASDGTAEGFNGKPRKGTLPTKCGWTLLARIDTRPQSGERGGQYGVSIADTAGSLGKFRYLLFDISQTEEDDSFGNTFYSEIDVMGAKGAATTAMASDSANDVAPPFVTHSTDGYCEITIDTSKAPELKEWAEQKLAPVLAEWYPKIVAMLPSPGYEAPKQFKVIIAPGRGVAATGGTRVTANSTWLMSSSGHLNPEAIGALLHEEVHVVQQYHGRGPGRSPGWLTEGIPDYIRWFIYEPQSHGADAVWVKSRRNITLNYDGMYRITANFLNYVVNKYDKGLITKLNAACRQATYSDDIWKDATGKTLQELNSEWKDAVKVEVAALGGNNSSATQETATAETQLNTLSSADKAAGWKLLFDGKDFDGWHNFKREGVRPGWEVKDGALVCVDPHNAGDIVTTDSYSWFELDLDYNISEGGNSGIMYHVTDQGNAAWATGPEFQLEDNAKAADPIRCGWLYALYKPPVDEKTGKTLDATKPAGEWNHVRLILTPQKCEHYINGVKYFEYVLGSDDFKQRVANSKFGRMSHFAQSDSGAIALQGDHGSISFRNIKLLPLTGK